MPSKRLSQAASTTPHSRTEGPEQAPLYTVVKVIDGDTLDADINSDTQRIRVIGLDTPETVDPRKPVQCFGLKASANAKELLEGRKVRLESDPTQGEQDKYGRLLRYVFLEDSIDFALTMIREGYGHEYTYNLPYKYQAKYKEAQVYARELGLGLWAPDACAEEAPPSPAPPAEPRSDVPSPAFNCAGNTYNCTEFTTHNQAQAVYECCLAQVASDIHGLDHDLDGSACETLP